METKPFLVISCILCVACIALGAFLYRGCATPDTVTVNTTDTLLVEKKILERIPVTRWRTITHTQFRTDTAYVWEGGPTEPESPGAEPIADTTFVRNGTFTTPYGDFPVGWNESVTMSYGPLGFRLEFADAPIIVPDVDICPAPADAEAHGFWTDALYVLAGIGAGALIIAVTK